MQKLGQIRGLAKKVSIKPVAVDTNIHILLHGSAILFSFWVMSATVAQSYKNVCLVGFCFCQFVIMLVSWFGLFFLLKKHSGFMYQKNSPKRIVHGLNA